MQTTISTRLYRALSRLGRLIHRMEHRMAHDETRGWRGVHRGHAHLLSIISGKQGASQRDLAEETDVRPSSMTETLLKMEAAGLITRRQDESDQRIMRIFPTETGEKLLLQSNDASFDLATRLFNGLTSEEQAQMLALIEKLSAGLEEMDQSAPLREHGHGFRHGHHRHEGLHGPHDPCGHEPDESCGPHGHHGPHQPHGHHGHRGSQERQEAHGPHGPHRGRFGGSHADTSKHPGHEDD